MPIEIFSPSPFSFTPHTNSFQIRDSQAQTLRSLTVKQLHDVSCSWEKERIETERERKQISRPFEKSPFQCSSSPPFVLSLLSCLSCLSFVFSSLIPTPSRKQAIAADPSGDGDIEIDGAPDNNVRL